MTQLHSPVQQASPRPKRASKDCTSVAVPQEGTLLEVTFNSSPISQSPLYSLAPPRGSPAAPPYAKCFLKWSGTAETHTASLILAPDEPPSSAATEFTPTGLGLQNPAAALQTAIQFLATKDL